MLFCVELAVRPIEICGSNRPCYKVVKMVMIALQYLRNTLLRISSSYKFVQAGLESWLIPVL